MASVRTLLVVPLLLGVAWAGCLEADPAPGQDEPVLPPVTPAGNLLDLLSGLPEPAYDAKAGVDWWENFVNGNSLRQWPLPTNVAAARYLETELRSAGFAARTLYVTPSRDGVPPMVTDGPVGFRVVQGLREGTENKDHRIALVAHYDTVFTTQQGAYDDGSGTAAEMQICKLLAKVPTNKTIECLFFDNEESGLLASQAYVEWYTRTKPNFVWDLAFGYDMTGLNWPGYSKWKLYAMIGKPAAEPESHLESNAEFLDVINYEFLGARYNVTVDGVEVLKVHDRNSDEQNFKRGGIPVIRYAGGRRAADYPQYHRVDDTVDFVYRFACTCDDLVRGKQSFSDGYAMVVLNSFYTILAYDRHDARQLPF